MRDRNLAQLSKGNVPKSRAKCIRPASAKISRFLEDVKKRSGYRQVAYWLKLMRQIPGHQEKFRKYVEQLRMKYSKRSALKEEIRNF